MCSMPQPQFAVRLAARQLTAELPNGPVAVGLRVPHVTRLRQGIVGSVSRDESVRLLVKWKQRSGMKPSAKRWLEQIVKVRCAAALQAS
jgi:hypothetical protein